MLIHKEVQRTIMATVLEERGSYFFELALNF